MFVIFNEKCSKRLKIKRIKLIIQRKSEQMLAYYHIDEDT